MFGFDSQRYKRRAAIVTWAPHVAEVGWIKWTKYKLAAYFAFHTGQDLPVSPSKLADNPGDLLTGTACRFMRRYLRTADDHADLSKRLVARLELLVSVLQSKKGMPRPDRAALDKAKKDTFATLTTHVDHQRYAELPVDGVMSKFPFELLEREVRRTVEEVYRGQTFSTDRLTTAFMPSMSANYNNTRSMFGTLGMLQEEGVLAPLPEFQKIGPEVTEQRIIAEELAWRMFDSRQERARFRTHVSQPALTFEEWLTSENLVLSVEGRGGRPSTAKKIYRMTNYADLDRQFEEVYFRTLARAMPELPLVEPVALPEALKVRVISKGPPNTYFCLKPVQKHMWEVLKDHPVFQLVGKPASVEALNDVIGVVLSDGEAYLSGDYKAATDNLRKELSECAWDEYCKIAGLPVNLWALGRNALTQHYFVGDDGVPVKQQAGQLMGSIISFPILCLVNAAVCRKAMEIGESKRLTLGRRRIVRTPDGRSHITWKHVPRLLINGDDCLFPISETGRTAWKALSTMAGLEESIGKVYYSKDFANVNSTNFVVDHSGERDTFVQVGYVNMGLLYGLKRSGGQGAALAADFDLASRQRELFALAPQVVSRSVLWKHFRRHNASALALFTENRIPWFVPKDFGGLGLEPVDAEVSRDDIRIVRTMVAGTLSGAPRPVPLKDPVPLQLHQFTTAVMEMAGVDMDASYTMEAQADNLDLRPLYLWSLFMFPSHVVPTAVLEEDQSMELIRHNRKVWDFYTRNLSKCLPPWPEGILPRFLIHSSTVLV